jgi:hypothetical protein
MDLNRHSSKEETNNQQVYEKVLNVIDHLKMQVEIMMR